MTDFDKTNRGAVWGNKEKKTDKHPDYTGSVNVDGVEYWISGWKRKPDANPNSPVMSFQVKRKDDALAEKKAPAKPNGKSAFDGFDDDVTF